LKESFFMIKRAEELLFYLLLFSIPFQTRLILWQQNWYFNEWQAVSLYGTDLLLIILFYFWFKTSLKFKLQIQDYFLLLFLLFSGLSILNADSMVISTYQFLKLTEFVLFYFYIKNYALGKFNVFNSFAAVLIGGFFQAIISIGQFIKQSDFGLRLFGETLLSPEIPGIATFINTVGEKILRPYGTTSHPNILAAYLFVVVFTFYAYFLYKRRTENKKREYALLAFYGILLFAFLLTFSRTVIFIFLIGLFIRWILLLFKGLLRKERLKIRISRIATVSLLVGIIFSFLYWSEIKSRASISSSDEAVALRLYYNNESLKYGVNLTGVGIGNFTNWLMEKNPYQERWFYQPVHNIYLLIYSETGLFGVAFFLLFLIYLIKTFISETGLKTVPEYSVLLMVASVLFIGFFDHFLLTLQQGRLVFWLLLAMLNTNYTQKIAHHT